MAARERGLTLLLKAPKKALVNELFMYTHENRYATSIAQHGQVLASKLEISDDEGETVRSLLLFLVLITN